MSRSIKAFHKRDRLYTVVIVEETSAGVCRESHWENLFTLKGQSQMVTVPREFSLGNAVTPAGAQ
jgi:hypothetical protein